MHHTVAKGADELERALLKEVFPGIWRCRRHIRLLKSTGISYIFVPSPRGH